MHEYSHTWKLPAPPSGLRRLILLILIALAAIGCTTRTIKKDKKTKARKACSRDAWKVERLGKALYQADSVTNWAQDALKEMNFVPDERIQASLTTHVDGYWKVSLIGADGEPDSELYTVTFPRFSPEKREIIRHDKPKPLSGDLQTMQLARKTAIHAEGLNYCSTGYHSIVLPANLIGEAGWFVYLLAPPSADGGIVFGRHYRIHITPDGLKQTGVQPLSKSCSVLDKPEEPEKGKASIVIDHVITQCPLETHVFLSLRNNLNIEVQSETGRWIVEGDDVARPRERRIRKIRRKMRWIQIDLVTPPLALFEPDLSSHMKFDLGVPTGEDQNGIFPSIEYQRRLSSWLAAGTSFGFGESAGEGGLVSNPVVNALAGICSTGTSRRMGWNGCIMGSLSLGLGLFDLPSRYEQGSHHGFLSDLRWSRFKHESLVIEPVLIAATRGWIGLQVQVGPSFSIPVYRTDQRDAEIGILYGFSFTTAIPFIPFGIGIRGFKELSGAGDHRFAMDFGVRYYIERPRLLPWIRVTVPVNPGESEMNTMVSIGISWEYNR